MQVLSYPGGGEWRMVGGLPSPRRSPAASSLAGTLHLTGGFYGSDTTPVEPYKTSRGSTLASVLLWDAVAETWSHVGELAVAR